ncbi:hypothetical protein FIBSPDRAFT_903856 [Athelia psychrophila]|uniref:Uncharacterized protein n=1 Tax=Athelia psychrophila TaxID=1759441 RepID=A0A167VG56_9AGAM|nr:hypothetical protein FIBSPDRAFT_903856 [Fibularhizoctonia sp. CBS 109695]
MSHTYTPVSITTFLSHNYTVLSVVKAQSYGDPRFVVSCKNCSGKVDRGIYVTRGTNWVESGVCHVLLTRVLVVEEVHVGAVTVFETGPHDVVNKDGVYEGSVLHTEQGGWWAVTKRERGVSLDQDAVPLVLVQHVSTSAYPVHRRHTSRPGRVYGDTTTFSQEVNRDLNDQVCL